MATHDSQKWHVRLAERLTYIENRYALSIALVVALTILLFVFSVSVTPSFFQGADASVEEFPEDTQFNHYPRLHDVVQAPKPPATKSDGVSIFEKYSTYVDYAKAKGFVFPKGFQRNYNDFCKDKSHSWRDGDYPGTIRLVGSWVKLISKDINVRWDTSFGFLKQEGNGNICAVGTAGEWGLMQLLPSTWDGLGGDDNHFSPWENVWLGMKHIDELKKQGFVGNNLYKAYNRGGGAVRRGEAGPQGDEYVRKMLNSLAYVRKNHN